MPRLLIAIFAFSLLGWGCASAPRQELQLARTAVAQAYGANAKDLAPTEYQAAANALKDGEYLFNQGEYRLAREILPLAASHAYRAKFKAWEEQARRDKQRKEQEAARAEAERQATLQAKLAKEPPKPAPPPKPKPAPSPLPLPAPAPPPPPPASYTVAGSETLWTIAAREDIYLDPLLWPLIYRANRDQIKDPRHLYSGQVLTIPRQVSEKEKEEARETARQSDIFPAGTLMKKAPQ
ncbi:peptidoglycan-binding protein LysM [Desulfuromonas versatilis]|uniref:Peptidoglycan-binding protein LysM n=1 Tax=Desulfuromonas versatilis TaxID=2802975 RepID=A0ABM8HVM5_9BACT|nr:LysM peptidoglycan-binding domain-containing protein [Desulfuromonas versatilis]BCR04593.1 peptidoglycan-binding protein LysM [Desulfuromonas versatilis]